MDWDVLYKELRIMNWTILLILASITFAFWGGSRSIGVFMGGVIIIANFSVLQHTIRRAFSPDGGMRVGKASIVAKYYLRILCLGIILYFLVAKGHADPIGMAIGLSTISLSVIVFGIRKAVRIKNGGAI